jgi:hypothetical protein
MIHLVSISETLEVLGNSILARSDTTLCTLNPSVSYVLSVCLDLAALNILRNGCGRVHQLR